MRRRKFAALAISLFVAVGCDSDLTRPSLYNQVEVAVTANGAPIPGAHLTLYTGARPMGFAETGADGQYTFRRVPQNGYGVLLDPLPAGYDTIPSGSAQKPANVIDGLDVSGQVTIHIEFKLLKQ